MGFVYYITQKGENEDGKYRIMTDKIKKHKYKQLLLFIAKMLYNYIKEKTKAE